MAFTQGDEVDSEEGTCAVCRVKFFNNQYMAGTWPIDKINGELICWFCWLDAELAVEDEDALS